MPDLLNHIRRHLTVDDPRRQEFERIAQRVAGLNENHTLPQKLHEEEIEEQRGKIISAVRGAGTEVLRRQQGVAGFRNVLAATFMAMTLLAGGVAVLGLVAPTAIPLCFQTEQGGQAVVVCPTAQSPLGSTGQPSGAAGPHVDDVVARTVGRTDLLVIELVGFIAAALAAAATIRSIRGSSDAYGLPVALALLKLPTGAITAFLGILLMSGEFFPGLTLDTSAQIFAWAIVFGYAQQLFTRLVDQRAHAVLDTVRKGEDVEPRATRTLGHR
ncbi:MAG: hypothetical protein ACRDRG_05910 [Pseudonocardiaceae bacterium]